MKLPRLQVRELIFFVVYMAIIGHAIVLSLSGPTYEFSSVAPSHLAGYVWVPASEMTVPIRGPHGKYNYSVSGRNAGAYLRPAIPYENVSPTAKAQCAERLGMTVAEMERALQVLVPEELVKQH